MFGAIGSTELLVIGVIALLIFGKRLPEVMRSLGKGVTEFKKGLRSVEDEFRGIGADSSGTETYDSSHSPAEESQPESDAEEALGHEGDQEEDYEDDYEDSEDDGDETSDQGDGTDVSPKEPTQEGDGDDDETESTAESSPDRES